MKDLYANFAPGLTAPGERAFAITPADATDLPEVTRALYVGGAGNLNLLTKSGDTVLFSNVQSGTVLAIRVARVLATSTTATGLVGIA